MKTTIAMVVVALVMSVGCAGHRTVGKQRIVETIPGKTPNWKGKSSWDSRGTLFFVGRAPGRSDYALGLREARADAEKKVVEQIRSKIRTEFGSAVEGQNVEGQIGSFVKDIIVKVSENVEVSGISEAETFVEKVEESTSYGVKYTYNCYSLLTLPEEDYRLARKHVFEGAVSEARKVNNQKAEESIARAFEKLKKTRAE